jgi:hypothetical protein
MCCIFIVMFLSLNLHSFFLHAFLSPGIATSINMHVLYHYHTLWCPVYRQFALLVPQYSYLTFRTSLDWYWYVVIAVFVV